MGFSGITGDFLFDLGAPRDFAPEIANLDDNVFLYDIDALEGTCEQNRKARVGEIDKAQRIIDTNAMFVRDSQGNLTNTSAEAIARLTRNDSGKRGDVMQAASAALWVQASAVSSHASTEQSTPSSQSTGVPARQSAAESQASTPLQNRPSSHARSSMV